MATSLPGYYLNACRVQHSLAGCRQILTFQSVSACTRTHRARQTENGRIFAVFFIPVGITILLKQLAAIGDAVFQSRYQKVKATVVVVVVVVGDILVSYYAKLVNRRTNSPFWPALVLLLFWLLFHTQVMKEQIDLVVGRLKKDAGGGIGITLPEFQIQVSHGAHLRCVLCFMFYRSALPKASTMCD